MKISMQRVGLETARQYCELGRTVVTPYNLMAESEDDVLDELNKPGENVFFLMSKAKPVGLFSYNFQDQHLYISQVATLPGNEHKGISRSVLCMVLSQHATVRQVDLVVHPHNIPAIALYERVGFTKADRPAIENYEESGTPRIWMEWTKRDAVC